MKKKIVISVSVLSLLLVLFLAVFPTIEIQKDGIFIACRYSDDISEFETELSFNENYSYYAERDISIHNFDIKKFLCFYIIKMEYVEGNYCETEFVLEEDYIDDFLEHAEITYNSHNIDVADLIDGKQAVVGNTRYVCEEYDWQIDYILDDRYETMFIFEVDDLLVIQIGFPDEGPRYIAYQ